MYRRQPLLVDVADLARQVLDFLLVSGSCLSFLMPKSAAAASSYCCWSGSAATIVVCRYCHVLNCRGISSLNDKNVTSTAPMAPPAM